MKILLTKRSVYGHLFLFATVFIFVLEGKRCPAQQHPFIPPPASSQYVGVLVPVMQPQETNQQPARVPFDEWNLSKPDYSPLRGKADVRLEAVLEQMRLSINAMQEEIVQSKEFLPQYQSPQYQMLSEPLATFVRLLREVGLDNAAEQVLDSLPKSYDNNQPVFDIRQQLQAYATQPVGNMNNSMPLKRNVQAIASTLQSVYPDGNGFFNYSSRPQINQSYSYGSGYYPVQIMMATIAMPQLMDGDEPESTDDKSIRVREKSYSAFARALVAAEKPDLDEVLQWNKQLTQNNRSSSNEYQQHLSCAVLLSAMGEQDAANQAVDNAFQAATNFFTQNQNNDHQVQAEGVVIREQYVWQSFIDALLRIGEYDAAVKMLHEMRENLTKLQIAGENVYWNQPWNEMTGRLATFSALEGNLDKALEYAELPLTKSDKNRLLYDIAGKLSRQGRMDEMKRVTESKNYVQQPGASFIDPNARYNKAKEIARTGNRETALATLQSLFDLDEQNQPGIPGDYALRNELGLLFLKWDDGPNARKLFTMVNDAIKSTMEQLDRNNPDYMFSQYVQFAGFLAARYRAGLTGETLEFAKTIRKTPGCILFNLTLAEEIANGSNQEDVVELLNAAYQAALTMEQNPGIPDIPDPNRGMPNRLVFRNDYLWAAARAALVAECLPEAQRFIQEAKALDANIPKISTKVRMMLNPNFHYQPFQASVRDQLWMVGVDRILKRERQNFDAAIIAASHIESPQFRNNAFIRISQAMLGNTGSNVNAVPSGGTIGYPVQQQYPRYATPWPR